MYKCPGCKTQTQAGEKQTKVVLESRKKVYTNEYRVDRVTKTKQTEGHEIVREVGMCNPCAAKRGTAPVVKPAPIRIKL